MAIISTLDLTAGQWVKVATDSPGGRMYKIKTAPSYLVNYVPTGDPAPTDNVGAIGFAQGINITSPIAGIDTYVKSRIIDGKIKIVEGFGDSGSVSLTTEDENTGIQTRLKSVNGGLKVADGLLQTGFINKYMSRSTALTPTTLAAPVVSGSRTITVVDATGLTAKIFPGTPGSLLEITSGLFFDMSFLEVIGIAGNILTLDRPIDLPYPAGAKVDERDINLAVDGSVTPQFFEISPPPGIKFELTRALWSMVFTSSTIDDTEFGDIANGLANGVVIQGDVTSPLFGVATRTIANWKNNGDMKDDMFDVDFTSTAGPTDSGQKGRWTFTNAGVVFSIHGNDGEQGRLIIQDDLAPATTTFVSFRVKLQGKAFLTPV